MDTIEPGQRPHLDTLRRTLNAGRIPELEIWINALFEQVQFTRTEIGEDAVSFIAADDETILPHLRVLAQRFANVLKSDSATVLPLLYDKIVSLEKKVEEISIELKNINDVGRDPKP